jgi:hypothetical protein
MIPLAMALIELSRIPMNMFGSTRHFSFYSFFRPAAGRVEQRA